VYSLYPKQNVSVWVVDGRGKQNCPIAVGYSVLNRTCKTNVGELMLKYGGGGHKQVGTCQVAYEDADRVIDEIVAQMKQDEKA
jgi:nanoRNase/pAp phosphatase (c-di-AMP/oligoRNAs hydrolase)